MNKRVLIVDDDWDLTSALKQFLDLAGYEVDTCHSAREAFSKLKEFSYRSVITDYEMPELTGIDFLELFLEAGRFPEKVIIFSGRDETEIPLYRLSKYEIRIWFIQKPLMSRLLDVLKE